MKGTKQKRIERKEKTCRICRTENDEIRESNDKIKPVEYDKKKKRK